jgi:hypothetical protein
VSVDEVDRDLIARIVFIGMGSATFPRVVERTGKHWARHLVARVPAEKTRRINDFLGKNFVRKYGNKQGIVVLGEVAPYGVGRRDRRRPQHRHRHSHGGRRSPSVRPGPSLGRSLNRLPPPHADRPAPGRYEASPAGRQGAGRRW